MANISLLDLLWIFLLVGLNGFFVASEFAFVKIRITQLNALVAQGSRQAKIASKIVHDLDRSLSSTQLGITLASIALGFVGEEFFTELFTAIFEGIEYVLGIGIFISPQVLHFVAFITGYLMITFMHVVMGELAPKSISIQFAEKAALWCAEPLWIFMKLTSPLLKLFVFASNGLLGLVGVEPTPEEHHQSYSEDELKVIIEDSIRKGHIEPYESRLIFNILDFTDSNVKAILTPRIDLEALPANTTPNDILRLSIETGYSRFPIYEKKLDNIIGFVHIKDVVAYANGLIEDRPDFKMSKVIRPVITVHEAKPLDDLLNEMQKQKTQMAAVIDEYGTLEGIVTIEDILEYIVGPIDDEFDNPDINISISVTNDKVIAGGLVSIDAFNSTAAEKFGTEIQSTDSATLAGYVLELFESEIPKEGMVKSDGTLEYKILKQRSNRIEEIEVTEDPNREYPEENID